MENKGNEMVNQMIDAWMKSQNELAATWAKAQKEGVERWAEAVAKAQESFLGFTLPEGPMKEARAFYASLMGTVVTSVKAAADDSAKIQETVKAGLERQVEVTREVAQRFAGLFPAVPQANSRGISGTGGPGGRDARRPPHPHSDSGGGRRPRRRTTMDKAMEIVDSWMKSQKEFMDNAVKSQRAAVEQWAEATKKMQETLVNLAGANAPAPVKEMQALYASWLATMVNSAKSFADESAKVQETWKSTVEKQMEMTREMVAKLADLFKQAGEKK